MTRQHSTKRALIASILVLCLCFTSLIGTTFAWFTDSVTSSGNIIQSGSLKVEMHWAEGDEDPNSAKWTNAESGAIFKNDLWEPGYAEAKHVKIANVGTLALKYQLRIVANSEFSKLADVIDVYYYADATQLDREDLDTATKLGTLTEVLDPGFEDAIHKVVSGSLEAGKVETLTLVLKMRESAGNDIIPLE